MTAGNSKLNKEARCAGWPEGSYSAENDTPETISWFGIYYRVGQKKGCWK